MRHDRAVGDEAADAFREPLVQQPGHTVPAGEHQQRAQQEREQEAGRLALRKRGAEARNGQKRRSDEQRPGIAADDRADVRLTEHGDGDRDRQGQGERRRDERHAREVFAEDEFPERDRVGERELERADAAFLRPERHAERGHQEHEQPRHPVEERAEFGLAEREDVAENERADVRHDEEDHEEDPCGGRSEAREELARSDGEDAAEGSGHVRSPSVMAANSPARSV